MSPPEWEAYSENNIARARNARSLSENLRRKIQDLLGSAFQQLNNQNSKVQLAFGKRVTETTNAKRQLENQHRRVSVYQFPHLLSIILSLSPITEQTTLNQRNSKDLYPMKLLRIQQLWTFVTLPVSYALCH